MSVLIGSIIGFVATLIGSLVTFYLQRRQMSEANAFQRRQMLAADRLTRLEKLRQERVDAYCSFADAVSEYRRSQMYRFDARRSGAEKPEVDDHDRQARKDRDVARGALFRVQLISGTPAVAEAAATAFHAMDGFKNATTNEKAYRIRDATYVLVTAFVEEARGELESRILLDEVEG